MKEIIEIIKAICEYTDNKISEEEAVKRINVAKKELGEEKIDKMPEIGEKTW